LNQTLSYSYNNDFNIDTFAYAGGDPVLYTYDDDGLLTGAGPYTISRNAGNGLPEAVYNGTLVISRTFNGYAEKDSQTLSVGCTTYAWNLKYDNSGRITDKVESIGGTTENSVYTYDLMGRLLSVTRDGILTEEYAYGENGARISEMNTRKGIIIPRSLSYSDEDQVLIAGEVIYIYDVDGFLQTKVDGSGTMTYTYSTFGELLCVELPDSTLIEYEYDPLNRRIAKKVDGVVIEKYLWSGLTKLLAVYNPDDTLRQRFVYVDARMPVAMEMDGAIYYFSYDQVGSIRVVADASGNVQKLIEYDTFGYVLSDSNPAFEMPLGFAGGLFDKDIGLIRFGARDYDPDTGRWTAKDPIRFAGGDADLYGYCVNDPVNLVDPKGLFGDGIRRGDSRLGHSDIFSGDRYDFTKEDHGPTSPYNQPSRHFRDLGDVERDLNDAIRRSDLDSFERHMHQGQDYFSHTENGYKWDPFHGKFGHLFAPDFLNFGPDYDLGAFIDANYWSENWIWKWEQRRNNPCR
jgi:RHS repeat-associated protein